MKNYFKVFTIGDYSIVTDISQTRPINSENNEDVWQESGRITPAALGDRWIEGQILLKVNPDGDVNAPSYDFTPFMDDIKTGFKALAQNGLEEAFAFVFKASERQERIYRDKFQDAENFLFPRSAAHKESIKPLIQSAATPDEWAALENNPDVSDPYEVFATLIYSKGVAYRSTQNQIDNIRRQADDLIASHNDFMSLVVAFKAFETQTRAYFAQSQLVD